MEASHFIPASRIGKPGRHNKFRDQNSLLNQSSDLVWWMFWTRTS